MLGPPGAAGLVLRRQRYDLIGSNRCAAASVRL